jgi:hypothetical protein
MAFTIFINFCPLLINALHALMRSIFITTGAADYITFLTTEQALTICTKVNTITCAFSCLTDNSLLIDALGTDLGIKLIISTNSTPIQLALNTNSPCVEGFIIKHAFALSILYEGKQIRTGALIASVSIFTDGTAQDGTGLALPIHQVHRTL